jgi:hypothetical protein
LHISSSPKGFITTRLSLAAVHAFLDFVVIAHHVADVMKAVTSNQKMKNHKSITKRGQFSSPVVTNLCHTTGSKAPVRAMNAFQDRETLG